MDAANFLDSHAPMSHCIPDRVAPRVLKSCVRMLSRLVRLVTVAQAGQAADHIDCTDKEQH